MGFIRILEKKMESVSHADTLSRAGTDTHSGFLTLSLHNPYYNLFVIPTYFRGSPGSALFYFGKLPFEASNKTCKEATRNFELLQELLLPHIHDGFCFKTNSVQMRKFFHCFQGGN